MNILEMEGFLRGKCIPRDMLVNETNAQYLIRKFSELERQRDDLLAELSSLKGFSDQLIEMHNGLIASGGGFHDYGSITYQQAALDAAMDAFDEIKTPATDAALREIGAKAVDEFAEKCSKKSDGCVNKEIKENWRLCGEHASEFAQQLREGKV
ncbi:hypothetical protein [Pectobacterium carotovorum]|uniref:hypothetical protein n=1 Tax=Pectobacterium carotovorum TaxID=554 RepID=UPI0021F2D623|nr:hypothetical protein [Pectobacterium carotovorum]